MSETADRNCFVDIQLTRKIENCLFNIREWQLHDYTSEIKHYFHAHVQVTSPALIDPCLRVRLTPHKLQSWVDIMVTVMPHEVTR